VAYDRNLASINRKLLKGSEILQDAIRERLAGGKSIAVLDIGCGTGVALLELAWMFRNEGVRFVGINKDAGEPLASRADFGHTARQIGLASENELARLELPELYFEDAARMHFEDNSFDLVYASSVLRFVPDKARLLEEVARVLKPGGVALIRVGSKGWEYPYGPASNVPELTTFASRWVLKHENELIPLEAFLKLTSGDSFDLVVINHPQCVIRITKHLKARLDLKLRYVPELSVPMTQLGYGDEERGLSKGGVRSVYDVTPAQYRWLTERGLLNGTHEHRTEHDDQTDVSRNSLGVVWGALQRAAAFVAVLFYTAPMTACASARTLAVMHRFHWKGAIVLGLLALVSMPAMKTGRLSGYRVGQRVNIKGRRRGRCLRAAKIKMVHHRTAEDHLEGTVDGVDPAHHTISLLGVTASADLPSPDTAVPLTVLKPGTRVRVRGRCGDRDFVASGIKLVPESPILIEEIQGPIQVIAPAAGVLQVSGITIVTDDETKIDRLDAR